MIGFNVAQAGHVVLVIPPVDGNNGSPVTAQRFSMKNWDHASILIGFGVEAGTPTSILIGAYTAASGGTRTAVGFYEAHQTAIPGLSNDVLTNLAAIAATGITTITKNNQTFFVLELDSAALPDGAPWVQLEVTLPASSNLVCAFAVLSAGRYAYDSSATVTA